MLLREFILLLESENDVKDLVQINARELKKKGFLGTPRELQTKAHDGPIFSANTLNAIASLTDEEVLRTDRKRYIKWFATLLEKSFAVVGNDLPMGIIEPQQDSRTIVDWINAGAVDDYLSYNTYQDAIDAAVEWHENTFKTNDVAIASTDKDVVYTWDDGWKIVNVPASDCDAEGSAMGHCVGKYKDFVEKGERIIFSLRDPNKKPHVTIDVMRSHLDQETMRYHVVQIKGKQNEVPSNALYIQKVKDWLKTTKFYYKNSFDYLKLIDVKEAKEFLSKSVGLMNIRGLNKSVFDQLDAKDITQHVDRLADAVGVDADFALDLERWGDLLFHEKIVKALKNSNSPEIREKLVDYAPNEVLIELASDPDFIVRLAVAEEIKKSVEDDNSQELFGTLDKLMNDDHPSISLAAKPRIQRAAELPVVGTAIVTNLIAKDAKSKYGFRKYINERDDETIRQIKLIATDGYSIFVKENGIYGIMTIDLLEKPRLVRSTIDLDQLPHFR